MSALFRPFSSPALSLSNRIVMAPMTRLFANQGVPPPGAAAYYRKRAEGGVGLIISEGTCIPHWAASYDDRAPNFHGEEALLAWRHIVDEVHAGRASFMPQLWHVGLVEKPAVEGLMEHQASVSGVGPSGMLGDGTQVTDPMTVSEIEAVIGAYAAAAASAMEIGCDGIEIHGAHGYLIDQFFWQQTNRRSDGWGADLATRTRFACEVIAACRAATGPDFPIVFRFSQWKQQDYSARLASSPKELEALLTPLVDAGTSIFHASTRRFWQPEFDGSALNLAGWARKLTGKPTITVGSVGLDSDFVESMFNNRPGIVGGLDQLVERLEQGEFDLVAVGRSLIANPQWPSLVRQGRLSELLDYDQSSLQILD